MAFAHMLNYEISAALAQVEKTLSLYPNSLFMLEAIGHIFTLLGEWEREPAFIRKAIKFNSFYDITVYYGLCIVDGEKKDLVALRVFA